MNTPALSISLICILVMSVVLGGCQTYSRRYVVTSVIDKHGAATESSGRFSKEQIAELRTIVKKVADDFGMEPYPGRFYLRKELKKEKPPIELLEMYYATFNPPGYYGPIGDIAMVLTVKSDQTVAVVAVNDLQHGGQTAFTRKLDQALEEALNKEFGVDRIHIEEVKGIQDFYAN